MSVTVTVMSHPVTVTVTVMPVIGSWVISVTVISVIRSWVTLLRRHLHYSIFLQVYWPGTAKRLIRISPQGIEGFLTIHRFGHQSGRGERSGGLSTAKIHDFSARVFLDRSQRTQIHSFSAIMLLN